MKYIIQFFEMLWKMAFLYGVLVLHAISAIAIVCIVLGFGLMIHDWWLSYDAI